MDNDYVYSLKQYLEIIVMTVVEDTKAGVFGNYMIESCKISIKKPKYIINSVAFHRDGIIMYAKEVYKTYGLL